MALKMALLGGKDVIGEVLWLLVPHLYGNKPAEKATIKEMLGVFLLGTLLDI